MKTLPILFSFSLLASATDMGTCLPGPTPEQPEGEQLPEPEIDPELAKNPLVRPSTQPYAAPEFGLIQARHFLPALEYGAKLQDYQISRIALDTQAPTFGNTIVELERSGRLFTKTLRVLRTMTRASADPELKALDTKASSIESAQNNAIYQNDRLYARVQAVYDDRANLAQDQRRLVEDYHEKFVHAGAELDTAQKAQLRTINSNLAQLGTTFGQNLATLIQNDVVLVEDRERLAGLSDAQIQALAQNAKEAGHEGKYLIRLVNTTRQPLLSALQDRALRKELWERSAKRGLSLNGPIVSSIVQDRDKKAKLLGFEDWAQMILDGQMAKSSSGVFDRLSPIASKIVEKTRAEANKLRDLMKEEGVTHDLEPWDWFYYAEQVRKNEFDFDESQLLPYFELNNVRENGVFFAMTKLFGVTFHERTDVPGQHPDVRVYEVKDEDGRGIGLLYSDDFTRAGKRGGAWINAWTTRNRLLGERTVVSTSFSYPKSADGAPTLLSFRQVESMFYALGYAVQALLVDVNYPSLASESLPRDFSGFPAQFFTYCAQDPEILANYAKHHKSGNKLPDELLSRMMNARSFNKGFNTLEYLKAAYLDLSWHTDLRGQNTSDIEAFEAKCFETHDLEMQAVPPRYRSTYFSHIFFSDYSAGYYSYLWNEIYASDAFEYMQSRGGINRDNGDRLRRLVLARGNGADPTTQYLDFRGKAPSINAYLKRLGLESTDE